MKCNIDFYGYIWFNIILSNAIEIEGHSVFRTDITAVEKEEFCGFILKYNGAWTFLKLNVFLC